MKRTSGMQRERFDSREEWLAARNKPMCGIGGSDAALICGIEDAFGNIDELYNVKRGISKAKSITNDRIEGGIAAEPHIRELFAIANKERYVVEYHGYDILRNDEMPWMFCTLDGELTDIETGEKGILEIKNIVVTKRAELDRWSDGRIPERYLVQQIHQLETTQWAFNLLLAFLTIIEYSKRTLPFNRMEQRHSYIRRDEADYRRNADYVVERERRFWECVLNGTRPATRII